MINSEKFDKACLILSGIFVIGTVWVWRNELRLFVNPSSSEVEQIVVRQDINDKDLKIERLEDFVTSTIVNLSVFQSSSTSSKVESIEIEEITTLPAQTQLVVPFTSQAPEKNWDQPWQDACEEAALLMMDAYYKNYNLSPLFSKDELLKIVGWEQNKNWGDSIEIEKVKQIAEEYFHLTTRSPDHLTTTSLNHNLPNVQAGITTSQQLRIIENPTVDDIKKSIASGNPVLVVADGKVLPNPHFRNGGPVYHALVVTGYNESEFITNDPGTQFGQNFKYTYDELMNAIRDWNNGNVKEGRKVILVLE